jgi:hypothetical protein
MRGFEGFAAAQTGYSSGGQLTQSLLLITSPGLSNSRCPLNNPIARAFASVVGEMWEECGPSVRPSGKA